LYIVPKRVGDKGFDKVSSHWNQDWDGSCIFLESNGLCKIHPVKPLTAKSSHCKDKEIPYKMGLANEWAQYFADRNEADTLNYGKLAIDFAGHIEKEDLWNTKQENR
jgi:hypothetical protein